MAPEKTKKSRDRMQWDCMRARCRPSHWARKPGYTGCKVSREFMEYAYFAKWAVKQVGWDDPDFELDKDLLVKGNKVYGPDLCVYLPRVINSAIRVNPHFRKSLPVGVYEKRGKFAAGISIDGEQKHIGTFPTAEQAFFAYKHYKEEQIRRLANLYRERIDPRAYAALMVFEVSIDD